MADFRAFLAELGAAAAETQDAGVRRSRQLLYERLFEEKDGQIVPRTFTVNVGDVEVMVPLFVLEAARPVRLGSFDIETETDISISDVPDPKEIPGLSSIQVGLKCGMFKRSSHARIKATFTTEDPPEAVEVLRDKLNQALREQFMQAAVNVAVSEDTTTTTEDEADG